jgi:hypothetical protein
MFNFDKPFSRGAYDLEKLIKTESEDLAYDWRKMN